MTVDKLVHVFAGTFILLSLALGVQASPIFHSSYWLWLTTFVGANLLQSGLTGFCPLAIFLSKLGVKEISSTGARA
jgi:Protein of unknown function (DUF2892)